MSQILNSTINVAKPMKFLPTYHWPCLRLPGATTRSAPAASNPPACASPPVSGAVSQDYSARRLRLPSHSRIYFHLRWRIFACCRYLWHCYRCNRTFRQILSCRPCTRRFLATNAGWVCWAYFRGPAFRDVVVALGRFWPGVWVLWELFGIGGLKKRGGCGRRRQVRLSCTTTLHPAIR